MTESALGSMSNAKRAEKKMLRREQPSVRVAHEPGAGPDIAGIIP